MKWIFIILFLLILFYPKTEPAVDIRTPSTIVISINNP